MCVIIHKLKDEQIDFTTIKKCFENNPDGCGIAIRYKDTFQVVKGIFNITDIWNIISYSMISEMIIHFRIRSAGNISKLLTHPFDIGDNINKLYYQSKNMIFHNGSKIICVNYKKDPEISDTYKLANILKNMKTDDWTNFLKIEEEMTKNKYVLVKDGQVFRIGRWNKHDGNWFSNMFWTIDYHMLYYNPLKKAYNYDYL